MLTKVANVEGMPTFLSSCPLDVLRAGSEDTVVKMVAWAHALFIPANVIVTGGAEPVLDQCGDNSHGGQV